MKKLLILFLFFIGSWMNSQQENNPFFKSENNAEVANSKDEIKGNQATGGPGNPGGGDDPLPVPIDDYTPMLLICAGGMIVYFSRKKSKLNMKY